MEIELSPSFKRSYKKRIKNNKKLSVKTSERIRLFIEDRKNPIIKDHALTGKKSKLRAFWVTGDVRIVYELISNDHAIFVDIGSHNQVY